MTAGDAGAHAFPSTIAAAIPAAIPSASPAQQQRPQLSPAELAARGEAPIKVEFLRTLTRVHVGAVTGGQLVGAAAAVAAGTARQEPAMAPAAEAERAPEVRAKSKKQAKKERSQQRYSSAELCTAFALGTCRFGGDCRFNHDVDAYLRSKPAELPGSCPFTAAERCPYGITCRWASTHSRPDELVKRFILDKKQQQVQQEEEQRQQQRQQQGEQQQEEQQDTKAAVAPGGGAAEVGAGASDSVTAMDVDHGAGGAADTPAAAPGLPRHTQNSEPQQNSAAGQAAPAVARAEDQGWWKRDGTIPGHVLEMPVAAAEAPPADVRNVLDKEVQQQLRRGTYPFQAADAVLASMGIQYHRDKDRGGGRGGGRGGRGQQEGGRGGRGRGRGGRGNTREPTEAEKTGIAALSVGEGGVGAGGTADVAAEGEDAQVAAPASKRPKLEPAGAEAGAQGGKGGDAAPMAVDAAAAGEPAAPVPAASDAAFLNGLGAPGDVPPSKPTAGVASDAAGVAPAAAAAAVPPPASAAKASTAEGAGYVEARPHPREKRSMDFRGKTFLAPLTTAGNLPFRRLCKALGADITCGEMALATNLLQGQPSEWALLKRHASEDCFGVQVCGGFPDSMARCAQLIEDQCEVDFVDINFGCPIDVVCSKGAGSACLLRPQRMQQIVRSMSSVLTCPLTFKMRKGYNDGEDIAHTLIPQAAGWGATAVTLHGRTREQRYSKLADWPYIQRCVDAAAGSGLQVVGNGDVFSYEDHFRHLEECPGMATTYIARGALVKPWIFTEIKERRHWDISAGERLDLFKRFCSFGLEHWGSDSRGVENTRRFLLEWLSFTHRYIPVGLLEVVPQRLHWRPPGFVGRNDLETLLASDHAADWVAISEMLLGPAPQGFVFSPKHKANSYARREAGDLPAAAAAAARGAAAPSPQLGAAAVGGAVDEEEY